MRIIAGSLKGRRLISPRNNDVRPTSDKVKEAVFSMLIPYMEEGFTAMDVFAGSGNMGIEAISRGAKTVFFSDSSRESLALVRENLKTCHVEDSGILLSGDFRSNIRRVNQKVDIFFLDPPYAAGFIPDALAAINEKDNISPEGVVVCEHAYKDKLQDSYPGFEMIKSRKYGAIGVTIYQRKAE